MSNVEAWQRAIENQESREWDEKLHASFERSRLRDEMKRKAEREAKVYDYWDLRMDREAALAEMAKINKVDGDNTRILHGFGGGDYRLTVSDLFMPDSPRLIEPETLPCGGRDCPDCDRLIQTYEATGAMDEAMALPTHLSWHAIHGSLMFYAGRHGGISTGYPHIFTLPDGRVAFSGPNGFYHILRSRLSVVMAVWQWVQEDTTDTIVLGRVIKRAGLMRKLPGWLAAVEDIRAAAEGDDIKNRMVRENPWGLKSTVRDILPLHGVPATPGTIAFTAHEALRDVPACGMFEKPAGPLRAILVETALLAPYYLDDKTPAEVLQTYTFGGGWITSDVMRDAYGVAGQMHAWITSKETWRGFGFPVIVKIDATHYNSGKVRQHGQGALATRSSTPSERAERQRAMIVDAYCVLRDDMTPDEFENKYYGGCSDATASAQRYIRRVRKKQREADGDALI